MDLPEKTVAQTNKKYPSFSTRNLGSESIFLYTWAPCVRVRESSREMREREVAKKPGFSFLYLNGGTCVPCTIGKGRPDLTADLADTLGEGYGLNVLLTLKQ